MNVAVVVGFVGLSGLVGLDGLLSAAGVTNAGVASVSVGA